MEAATKSLQISPIVAQFASTTFDILAARLHNHYCNATRQVVRSNSLLLQSFMEAAIKSLQRSPIVAHSASTTFDILAARLHHHHCNATRQVVRSNSLLL
jgi:hypothetical protein